MSLAQRFERRLEGMVGSAFARLFKGQVEPVEIGNALQREANDKKAVMGNGRLLCPNRYRVTLAHSDYERLIPWETQLTTSLAELVQEHLDENEFSTIGDIEVYLAEDANLRTGVFGVASRMEPQAPPRRRPYDSMSMPVVKGHPDEYVHPFGSHPIPQLPVPPAPVPPAPVPPVAAPPLYESYGSYEPAVVYSAQLVVDGTTHSLQLRQGSNIVGRSTEADLQLLDQGVSRKHIDVFLADNRVILYDLGSTNGTSINGHNVSQQQLQHGDVIRVGHTRLVFHEDPA